MDKEWLMIASMGLGGTLFAIGGTGFKWARRFVLPFTLGIISYAAGVLWWKCLCMSLGMSLSLCLPYEEKRSYLEKFLVGISFVLPTLFIGFTWWQVITPILFTLMFKLSNTKWAGSTFVWKVVEFLTGSLIGITVATLL